MRFFVRNSVLAAEAMSETIAAPNFGVPAPKLLAPLEPHTGHRNADAVIGQLALGCCGPWLAVYSIVLSRTSAQRTGASSPTRRDGTGGITS